MNKRHVGTCSLCGGSVAVDTMFHSTVPPTPTCEGCGARAKARGPVIDMEQPHRNPQQPSLLPKIWEARGKPLVRSWAH